MEQPNNTLWIWCCQERKKDPSSGPIIKNYALIVLKKLGGESKFTVEDWIDQWKTRQKVGHLAISSRKTSS